MLVIPPSTSCTKYYKEANAMQKMMTKSNRKSRRETKTDEEGEIIMSDQLQVGKRVEMETN